MHLPLPPVAGEGCIPIDKNGAIKCDNSAQCCDDGKCCKPNANANDNAARCSPANDCGAEVNGKRKIPAWARRPSAAAAKKKAARKAARRAANKAQKGSKAAKKV